jgi:hypothetical protein
MGDERSGNQEVKARSCYMNLSDLKIHRIPDGSLLLYPNPKRPLDMTNG